MYGPQFQISLQDRNLRYENLGLEWRKTIVNTVVIDNKTLNERKDVSAFQSIITKSEELTFGK